MTSKISLQRLKQLLFITAVAAGLGFFIVKADLAGAGILIALPFALLYLYWLFKNPKLGIYSVVHLGFIANGLARYTTAPVGLLIDIFLLLSLVATLSTVKKEDYVRLKNPFVYGAALWTLYTVFEVINPEARSFAAWFYAVRGVSLYMVQLIIITLLVLNDRKDLQKFINIWIFWSAIACIYGMKQLYVGVNSHEQEWLDAGAYKTHILFGRLRVFSFYSDAGQFGAAMGHILLVCVILALGPIKAKQKLIYWCLALLFFWGMAISGTRGALFVPLSGIMIYLLCTKNFKSLMAGGLVVSILFCLLKFTSVGSGNYQVQRMRTALDPNDASLQVRLGNQKKLGVYLASRPIGGGIGSAGSWGQRFSPGTLLADTPTDSWYVKLWAETGIVGLWLYMAMILMFIGTGVTLIFKMKHDMVNKQIAMALLAGFVGIAFASYGNQILGQSPSVIVAFMSIVFISLIYKWDKQQGNEIGLSDKNLSV